MLSVDLHAKRGDFQLNAAFDAPAGVTALFGPSGAGKSTILSMIAGLDRPDHGRIEVDGRPVFDNDKRINVPVRQRKVGLVFQDGRLFPHLTVAGNLAFGALFAGRSARAERDRLVALLGLEPLLARMPAKLSGGERQRVALARAVLARPDVLLCDEPLAALDAARKAEVLPYFAALSREIPILYVTHAMAELLRLADTVVLLADGRTVAAGSVADVFADAASVAALGPREVGAVVEGHVSNHSDGLTEVAFGAARLTLPPVSAPLGAPVRVRVRASDVILSRIAPEGMSTNNILSGEVVRIDPGPGPGSLVSVAVSGQVLMARVTQKSAAQLVLAPGTRCFVVLKALAVAPDDITVRA